MHMSWIPASTVTAYSLCAVMFLFGCALRLRSGSWSNPSVVFALFWGMMTLMPVLFVPDIKPSVYAIGYVTVAVIAFGMSAFFLDWRAPLVAAAARRESAASSPFMSGNEAPLLLLLAQVAGLITMMANVAYQGFSVRDFVFDPFAIGCEYLGYRYSGSVKPFVLMQLATILNYVAAAFAGLIVSHRRNYVFSAGVVLLCMLPSLYSIAVYADKGTIFLSLAFFYGAVVVGRIRSGCTALVTWRSIVSAPLILVIVAGVIGLAMANRMSEVCSERQTSNLTEKLVSAVTEPDESGDIDAPGQARGLNFYIRSYAFGHLFAFSSWFEHRLADGERLPVDLRTDPVFKPHWNTPEATVLYRNPEDPTFGFWTFMAIGKYLDSSYFKSLGDGYYEEYFRVPGVLQTNIYTFFRGAITDFTIAGSFIFFFISGLLLNVVYRRMLNRQFSPISQSAYILYAGYLYTSYIISLFIWNSALAAAFGIFVMLVVIDFIDRNGGSLWGVLSLRSNRIGGTGEAK